MVNNSNIFIARTIAELKKWRNQVHGSVGFIPTMGYLHEGHVSLMNLARKENDFVVVSIFVNPKQFAPNEDFTSYPRDEAHDMQILTKAHVDMAFLPRNDEIYPPGFKTHVSVTDLSKKLEGKQRPGHFDGVTTVVSKLFNIIQPHRAYFGQKDAQQVVIIKKMVSDLQFPLEIVIGETKRESNGLALSSRNIYLNNREKEEASILYKSLLLAQKLCKQGERNSEKIKEAVQKLIKSTSGKIDYISIANQQTLDELSTIKNGALISLAVYFGKTRLIDNCIISL